MQNKRKETDRRTQVPTLKRLLKALPLLLIAFNKKGEIIEWNQECFYKTGFSGPKELNDATKSSRPFLSINIVKAGKKSKDTRDKDDLPFQRKMPCKNGKILTLSWINLSRRFPILGWDQYWLGMDLTDSIEKQKKLELIAGIIQSPSVTDSFHPENILPHRNEPKTFSQSILILLTAQEREILTLICQGKTNKEIGALRELSDQTVRNYISRIFKKLNVSRRSEAVAYYMNILLTVANEMYSRIE